MLQLAVERGVHVSIETRRAGRAGSMDDGKKQRAEGLPGQPPPLLKGMTAGANLRSPFLESDTTKAGIENGLRR